MAVKSAENSRKEKLILHALAAYPVIFLRQKQLLDLVVQRGFSGGDASQFNQGLETDRLAMQIVKVEALKWVNNDELLDWQSPGVSAPGQYLVPLMIKKNDWCSGVIF